MTPSDSSEGRLAWGLMKISLLETTEASVDRTTVAVRRVEMSDLAILTLV